MGEPNNFSAAHFGSHEAAREWLEMIRWPNGPSCPRCRTTEPGRRTARRGVYLCGDPACGQTFSVITNTIMERTKLPLHKWAMAFHLIAPENGNAVHRLQRALDVNYQTAWHLVGRIRAVIADNETGCAEAVVKAALSTPPKTMLGRDRQVRRQASAPS